MPNKTVSKFTTGAVGAALAGALALGVGAPAAQVHDVKSRDEYDGCCSLERYLEREKQAAQQE